MWEPLWPVVRAAPADRFPLQYLSVLSTFLNGERTGSVDELEAPMSSPLSPARALGVATAAAVAAAALALAFLPAAERASATGKPPVFRKSVRRQFILVNRHSIPVHADTLCLHGTEPPPPGLRAGRIGWRFYKSENRRDPAAPWNELPAGTKVETEWWEAGGHFIFRSSKRTYYALSYVECVVSPPCHHSQLDGRAGEPPFSRGGAEPFGIPTCYRDRQGWQAGVRAGLGRAP